MLLLAGEALYAQSSEKGTPDSFRDPVVSTKEIMSVTMPAINVDSLLQADKVEEKLGMAPRFGSAIDADINIKQVGDWEELPDGTRLWRVRIVSPGAYSINLIFGKYYVPKGGKLYVYSEDKKMVIGAFTARNNKPHGKFSTMPVKGSSIILEYNQPVWVNEQPQIQISKVVHAYKIIHPSFVAESAKGKGKEEKVLDFGQSDQDCQTNIHCPIGEEWCREKNAVCMTFLDENTRHSSASLINNVRQDFTPYVLMAFHSVNQNNTTSCSLDDEDVSTWLFWFHYWSNSCANGTALQAEANVVSFSGAEIIAGKTSTDFALLKISSEFEVRYEDHLYFLGWSRTTATPNVATCIHHPSGDIMKICVSPLSAVAGISSYCEGQVQSTFFWDHDWNFTGATEGGSSGAPILNENHKVIGQLTTGGGCGKNSSSGKFYLSWDYGSTPQTRLKDWLDPDNKDVMELEGLAPKVNVYNRILDATNYPERVTYDAVSGTFTYVYSAATTLEIAGGVTGIPTVGSEFRVDDIINTEFKAGRNINIKPCTHIWNKRMSSDPSATFHAYIIDPPCVEEFPAPAGGDVPLILVGDPDGVYPTGPCDFSDVHSLWQPGQPESIQVGETTGIPKRTELQDGLEVWPNPVHSIGTIRYTTHIAKNVSIFIMDVYGQRVVELIKNKELEAGEHTLSFDTNQLSSGVYYVALYVENRIETVRVVVMR